MEPTYDADAVRTRRQRRIARTRVAAAVASGVTFGAAVAGFALHDHARANTSTVSATTPTTTLDQPQSGFFNDDNGLGGRATPGDVGGRFDTGTRGS